MTVHRGHLNSAVHWVVKLANGINICVCFPSPLWLPLTLQQKSISRDIKKWTGENIKGTSGGRKGKQMKWKNLRRSERNMWKLIGNQLNVMWKLNSFGRQLARDHHGNLFCAWDTSRGIVRLWTCFGAVFCRRRFSRRNSALFLTRPDVRHKFSRSLFVNSNSSGDSVWSGISG